MKPAVPAALLVAMAWQAQDAAATEPAANVEACAKAHEAGQERRLEKKLRDARDAFRLCAATTCPRVLSEQCATWLTEVQVSLPSLAVAVRDASGRDVAGAKVTLDGSPLPSGSAGAAVEVDPGEHTVRAEVPGSPPAQQKVVILEGEKNRLVSLLLEQTKDAGKAPVSQARSSTWPAFASFGIGIAGFGTFGVLGALASSDVDALKKSCAPNCRPNEMAGAKTKALVADIGLGVGIAGAALGTFLLVAHSVRGSRPPEARAEQRARPTRATFPTF